MRRIFFLVTILTLFLLPMSSVMAASSDFGDRVDGMTEITGVRMSTHDGKTRLVIDAKDAITYKKPMVLSNPGRVVVDIPNAWISSKVNKFPSGSSAFVENVRIAQFNKSTVRIVVETSVGASNYKVFALKNPNRLVMDFGELSDSTHATIALPDTHTATNPSKTTTTTTSKNTGSSSQASEVAKETTGTSTTINKPSTQTHEETPVVTNGSLQGRKITLDPGHGGNDSGAIGPTGVMEKSVTLRVATEVERLLQNAGATVYMTRTTDTEVSPKGANASDIEELQARCDVGNNSNSDIFVSIHMDSFSGPAARGTTGYYYSLSSQAARTLADKIRQGVVNQLGTQSRGTQSCNFYVVKHTQMPATLVEVAFISNPSEEALMNSADGIKKAAQGIFNGIVSYFNN